MRIDITNRYLDLDKLMSKVETFELTTGQQAYLFMNPETIDYIKSTLPKPMLNKNEREMSREEFEEHRQRLSCSHLLMYKGRRVYEDSRLNYGEVEIR